LHHNWERHDWERHDEFYAGIMTVNLKLTAQLAGEGIYQPQSLAGA
jgi:hypothetical protein